MWREDYRWPFVAPGQDGHSILSILIAKSVQFELGEISTDPQGRYVFLSSKLFGEPFLLMAFYVPPPFSINIILEGLTFMARYPTVQVVWMGDFNTTMNDTLDRLRPPTINAGKNGDTKFYKLISSIHLIDTWRNRFPCTHAFLPLTIQCHTLILFLYLHNFYPDY